MPAWSALQRVSDVNVTQAIADAFLALAGRAAPSVREMPRRGVGD